MAANFGELVLVVGDHHLPSRAVSIPEPFQKMLVPNKMQHVVCTGNIGWWECCVPFMFLITVTQRIQTYILYKQELILNT